jgi:hypothetical protein
MRKFITTIVNFKKACMRKLKRSKIAIHTNIVSSISKDLEKKKEEMIIVQKIKLHDRLYDYADKLIKEYDPCKIENGKCVRLVGMCCGGCKYLTEDGCSTKCLWCKLWLCDYLLKKPEYWPLISKLRKIEKVANRKKLLIDRGSKEDLERYLKMPYKRHFLCINKITRR